MNLLRKVPATFTSNEPNADASMQTGMDMAVEASSIIGGRAILGLVVSLIATAIFSAIWDKIEDKSTHVTELDRAMSYWMYAHRTRPLTIAAHVLEQLGSVPGMVVFGVGGLILGVRNRKTRGIAWTLPIAVLGTSIIITTAKLLFHRHRPTYIAPLWSAPGYSFPSGHSLFAVAIYGLVGYFALNHFRSRRARTVIVIVTTGMIIFTGVSRVYIGVHFPTDVVAGWAAGVPWLIACIAIHERLARRFPRTSEPVLTTPIEDATLSVTEQRQP